MVFRPMRTWLVTSVLATLLLQVALGRYFHNPFPPLSVSLSSQVTSLYDFTGIMAGLRRLSADMAWIRTLTYYGTPEAGQTESEFENGFGNYPLLLAHCQRVTRIDPHFIFPYYYGAGALGWNLGRWDEAEALLRQGIENNPKAYRLQQYLLAMSYRNDKDSTKLVQFLESFMNDPECPNLVRSILANLYKKQKRYDQALAIWLYIYKTGDPGYLERASEQIRELTPLVHMGQKSP